MFFPTKTALQILGWNPASSSEAGRARFGGDSEGTRGCGYDRCHPPRNGESRIFAILQRNIVSNGTDYKPTLREKAKIHSLAWCDPPARTASLIFRLVPGGEFVISVDDGGTPFHRTALRRQAVVFPRFSWSICLEVNATRKRLMRWCDPSGTTVAASTILPEDSPTMLEMTFGKEVPFITEPDGRLGTSVNTSHEIQQSSRMNVTRLATSTR